MEPIPEINLPEAPVWSLQLGQLGSGLIWAAIIFFLVGGLLSASGKNSLRSELLGRWAFVAGVLAILGAFVSLGVLFARDRFEFAYVYGHSDISNELRFKIAGIWAGQQGSFLLWAVSSGLFGLLGLRTAGNYRRVATIVFSLFLAGLAAILAYESPFAIEAFHGKYFVPPNGVGLSPSLQNYWITIHPPTIFLGFGSLTYLFAMSIAAMTNSDRTAWIPRVRPWALVSLALLGLGLCMGGFWAYETLGWGGFWMWDPVENTSFVPWCFVVIFVHGMIVQSARQGWQNLNLLLGAVPFLSFCYGTFLTRSGLLGDTSVHSFAKMDNVAHKILLSLIFAAGLVTLYFWVRSLKSAPPKQKIETAGLHRRGLYTTGTLLVAAFAFATGFGMSVPLVTGLLGMKQSAVEEGVYHQVLTWLFLPVMVIMAIAPFTTWKGLPTKAVLNRVYGSFCLAFFLTGVTGLIVQRGPGAEFGDFSKIKVRTPIGTEIPGFWWILLLVGLCYFVMIANAWRIGETFKKSKLGIGGFLSHAGLAVLLAGLIISRGWEQKGQTIALEGDAVGATAMGFNFVVKNHTSEITDRNNKVNIDVHGHGDRFVASPGQYVIVRDNGATDTMIWPYVHRTWWHDVYVTLHPMQYTATGEVPIKVGETVQMGDYKATYKGMDRVGEAGMAGTKFVANLEFQTDKGAVVAKPYMALAEGAPERMPAKVDDTYFVAMTGMDAATQSGVFQLYYSKPLYPIEVFYKPMTILVWAGTGMLTAAVLLTALYRRNRGKSDQLSELETDDALAPSH